ncbi:MAG: hypothetical protein Q8M76_11000 [Spirochaetaceae bacterium]|nr:hypothetical protein [Spirochaetaceae bacterium]
MPFDPLVRQSSNGRAHRPELTQGAVVEGIRLPRYGSGSYRAILITARCDLAHVRTDTINLLPVVPLSEWIQYDGCIAITLSRILSLEGKIRDQLAKLPAELTSLMADDWLEGYRLFVEDSEDVHRDVKSKLRPLLEERAGLVEGLRSNAESPAKMQELLSANAHAGKIFKDSAVKKVTELMENKVLDAHFLPVIRPEERLSDGAGYVVLFRQIIALPGRLVVQLANGIASEGDVAGDLAQQARQLITFPAGVVANVCSPHVEHIMQRFSNVFGRIGVQDCSSSYKERIAGQYAFKGGA